MPDERAFLDTIAANPTEEGPLLVYSDWLDEQPDRQQEACNHRLLVQLRRVIAAPDDDAPRLEYAFICDSHGRSDRAEFIRVQLQLAVLEANPQACESKGECRDPKCPEGQRLKLVRPLRERQAQLLNTVLPGSEQDTGTITNEWEWARPIGFECRPRFCRGFVEEMTTSWVSWVDGEHVAGRPRARQVSVANWEIEMPFTKHSSRAAAYLAAAPLRCVTLTNPPHLTLGQPHEVQVELNGMICIEVSRAVTVGDHSEVVRRETKVNDHSRGIMRMVMTQLQNELDKDCTLEAWCRRRWPSVSGWLFQDNRRGEPEQSPPQFDLQSLPLPISRSDFSFAARDVQGNRRYGPARREGRRRG